MIIDQLNTELTGGAGISARRLHGTLRELHVESRLWCARLPAGFSEPGIATLPRFKEHASMATRVRDYLTYAVRKIAWRADKWRYLKGRSNQFEMFSIARLPRDTPFPARTLTGDVLHLHWVTKFLDWPSFFASIPAGRPVVWTLHDMSPLTGGCHHADGCEGFFKSCGSCPQLMHAHPRDLSYRVLEMKRLAMRHDNIHIVTPSRWLERWARQSVVLQTARSIQTIYNGLDLREYTPLPKAEAREALGLPPDGLVIAFGAAWLPNRRKGFVEYAAAMSRLAAQHPVMGLIFGDGDFPTDASMSFPHRRVGLLQYAADQRRVYSAADIFVLSSLGENLAQTGVESLACGTPVVSFDVGGLPEYVRPGETGLLARWGDIEDLSAQIAWLIEHPEERHRMSLAGPAFVQQHFDHQRQARRYIDLYESLLAGAARSAA